MKQKIQLLNIQFILLLICSITAFGEVRIPRLISDGMVLQRDVELKIWGWAALGEKITVNFNNQTVSSITKEDKTWSVVLSKMPASGPYEMTINGNNKIVIKDVVIGDVWLCSGQSNMELNMRRASPIYQTEIANCENSSIRQFIVPQKYNFNVPQNDLSGGSWKSVNPQSINEFSAVAYFFAKELFDIYKVPIGIINASLGGSPAEAWLSEDAIKNFPDAYQEAQKFKDSTLIVKIEKEDQERIQAWYNLLNQKDEGYKIPGLSWRDPDLNTSGWSTMHIPGYWADGNLGPVNGVVWFRKNFSVKPSFIDSKVKLDLGRIVDADSVFVNGTFVGTVSYQYPPRRYEIPAGVLKAGDNVIVVRLINNSGKGGFVLDKKYEVYNNYDTVDLAGDWKYKLGAKMDPLGGQTFVRWKPTGLYNAMINPLVNFKIKGIVWYQGESNTWQKEKYYNVLTTLINDWRNKFQQGNTPFIIAQLPNFMEPNDQPIESDWASLRFAQFKALSLPNTGLAVNIDLGEWNDIHPLNKKDVAMRLALAARKIAYGDKNLVYSGPLYNSMKIEGNKIVLSFLNIGSGLIVKGGGELKCFAIAGDDKKFVWANAKIEKNRIIVWNDNISNPLAVRYAWANNPAGANLFNAEGLPASPFTTKELLDK
jgi:sialate O-acetylesterase